MGHRPLLAALAACVLLLALTAPASSARSLRLGFTDRDAYQGSADDRTVALRRTRGARASFVRILSGWPSIATRRPPSRADARNPAWPGYRWQSLDAELSDVTAAGLVPVLSLTGAPGWAEGRNRPAVSPRAPAGTWKPSPARYRDFARALGRRYSGSFRDPGTGSLLPRVRYLQGWNEPNLARYLSPQWERRGRRFAAASPGHYRRLQNAFYDGVKAANPGATVITAGTAPFGDPRVNGLRLAPARFIRQLLCVRGRGRPVARRCPKVRFNAFSHHPYSVGGPTRRALNPDDVTVPDLRKLTRPLRAAQRRGTVRPRGRKALWVTELSWDSRPPDPRGVPAARQARWLQGSFSVLQRQGVEAITWFHLRDEPRGEGYPFTFQSGVFFRGSSIESDRPKPSLRAFRFPFTAYRSGARARLWGLAPRRGRVVIEARRGGRWRVVKRLRARRGRGFKGRLRTARGTRLRARQGGEVSLVWR